MKVSPLPSPRRRARILLAALAAILPLSAPAAEVLHHGAVYENPPFPFAHTSTLAETAPGTILAASVGGPASRDPGNGIWIARRENGKWSAPRNIAQEEAASWNPVLWKDARSGELILFYKIGVSPENWTGAIMRSADGGATWSKRTLLPAGMTGCVRSRPLALPGGALLCGDSVESWNAWACWVNRTGDLGKTWRRFGPVTLPGAKGIIQPVLFWADADRTKLRMLARAPEDVGKICSALSADQGQSWSAPEPTALANPNSALDAVNLKDGRVALVHNPQAKGRNILALSFSADGGATWGVPFVLAREPEGVEASYPSMIEAASGELHITYTANKTNIGYFIVKP